MSRGSKPPTRDRGEVLFCIAFSSLLMRKEEKHAAKVMGVVLRKKKISKKQVEVRNGMIIKGKDQVQD